MSLIRSSISIGFASAESASNFTCMKSTTLGDIPCNPPGETPMIHRVDLNSLCLRISRSENLPILPTVLIQILRLYEDPNVSPRSLERIIEQDAALTAKILRVAGSSLYGAKSATTVGRALSVLGMNALRSIAVSLAYQQILAQRNVGADFDRMSFWRHCLAVGVGAKAISKYICPSMMEEMYVTGLMHDIGILTLDRFMPNDLTSALRKAMAQKVSIDEAERQVLGFDHAEVGGHLAETWKLSQSLIDAVKYHHHPERDSVNSLTTGIVAAANYLAYKAGYPALPGIPGDVNGEAHLEAVGLTQDQIDMVSSTIMIEVDQSDTTYGSQRAA